MFSLTQWFVRKVFLSKKTAQLLIIGVESSGKTSLLNDFKRRFHQETIAIIPTNGVNSSKFKYKGIAFELYDLGGDQWNRKHWSKYFPQTDIVLFVVDCSAEDKLDIVKQEFENIVKDKGLEGAAFCICCNKMDKGSSSKIKSKKDLIDFLGTDRPSVCGNRSLVVLETVTGSKIEEDFAKYKQQQRKKGIRQISPEDQKYDEEQIAKFPLNQHYGVEEILSFVEDCIKNDKYLKKRKASKKKKK